jgi:hypothetical protein
MVEATQKTWFKALERKAHCSDEHALEGFDLPDATRRQVQLANGLEVGMTCSMVSVPEGLPHTRCISGAQLVQVVAPPGPYSANTPIFSSSSSTVRRPEYTSFEAATSSPSTLTPSSTCTPREHV